MDRDRQRNEPAPSQVKDTPPVHPPPDPANTSNEPKEDENPKSITTASTTITHVSAGHPPSPSQDKLVESKSLATLEHRGERMSMRHLDHALPPLPRSYEEAPLSVLRRGRTYDTIRGGPPPSNLDWIVPLDEKSVMRPKSIAERLAPTIENAKSHRQKFSKKAKQTGLTLNVAIALQVILGSLTTGLSVVATTGRQTAIQTTILGGLTTIIASYLARQRGSGEPEFSMMRVKDLDKFIRETEAYLLDHGHCSGPEYDQKIEYYRQAFEEILGNGTQDSKTTPPA
ncbi:hypothetical protein CC1G_11891 [Coprinopsis cinerea okayama7|uniref:SMODS and SLOG-associating 2TM effector domain-containing protein n=1 Tax=Coprinopsis cinerea (strain Okayama-7 / 130 / ATCC MYA-4618 / FGSC 9003) TaxID=240176 RepID=A8P3K2_COPC7|nr:hypothetical protein CC1G_11891 [Coprinopsis cinerea okayama7\|eukprot:XP_001838562.2 hypothetical protein CC1G_11891 [Coprinopsis cinerea okayama7\